MKTLFTITVLELLIGGGGRLFEVGPVTVRMILFVICLCVGFSVAISRMEKAEGIPLAIILVSAYLFVHITGILIGLSKGNDLDVATKEMQLSLYWLAAIFFAQVLHSRNMVVHYSLLVRFAGLFLAVAYIGVILSLAIGMIDYSLLYSMLSMSDEFSFRSSGFFVYKGFIYLGISAIFFVALPGRYSAIFSTLIIAALAMTLTRGFILSTVFAMLLMLMMQRRWRQLGILTCLASCALFFVFIYMPLQDEAISLSREISNGQRIDDFAYIVENFRANSLFFGEGMGTPINDRINIENTFLWALWRLGIFGVLFWLCPLIICHRYFMKIKRGSPQFNLACAYYFSTILIYVQTMSNPYLNNSIGLSFILAAIFSLRTLSRIGPNADSEKEFLYEVEPSP